MDTATIWTIAGVVATVVFGILSVVLAIKIRNRGKILYIHGQAIGLFESIVKNMPQITVAYDGKPVSHSLTLINGIFKNNGFLDITKEMVECPISIELPLGYHWVSARVTGATRGVEVSTHINSQVLSFSIAKMFKTNDAYRFEALFEATENNQYSLSVEQSELVSNFTEKVSFFHRVQNTNAIKPVESDRITVLTVFREMRSAFIVFMAFITSFYIYVAYFSTDKMTILITKFLILVSVALSVLIVISVLYTLLHNFFNSKIKGTQLEDVT